MPPLKGKIKTVRCETDGFYNDKVLKRCLNSGLTGEKVNSYTRQTYNLTHDV